MPTIKKWQLVAFKQYAGSISAAKQSPLLEYLLVSPDATITKSNLQTVCKMRVEFLLQQTELYRDVEKEGFTEPLLVHERTLYGLVDTTAATDINISQQGEEIVISDGKTVVRHSVQKFEEYPRLPQVPDGEYFIFDQIMLKAMKVARRFASDDENAANFQAIHVKDKTIGAINNAGFFVKEFSAAMPTASLSREQVAILNNFENVGFKETDNHYFFRVGADELLFAFTKSEWKTVPLESRVAVIKKSMENGVQRFVIPREELLGFCDFVSRTFTSKITPCILEEDSTLRLYENQYNHGAKKQIVVLEGKPTRFNFNSSTIIEGVRALPQDKFNCFVLANETYQALIISEVDGSYACFMGSAPITN
jgi:hypothetical protein